MKIRMAMAGLVALSAAIAPPSSPRAKQEPSSTELAQSVWDGVYTREQANRGAALYAERCALCHGQDLTGGEIAPALNGGEFKSNWSGLSVDDLFERIKVSMPQNNPGSLSRQQTADVLAFVLFRNGFPAGKTELAREAEVVKQVRFEQNKPGSAASPVNSITISAFRDSVKTKSPVYIIVEFKNNSDHDLEFGRVLSGADCRIDVRDVQGKLPPETGFGYIHNGHVAHPEQDLTRFSLSDLTDNGLWASVKAGQSTEWVINAARFYDMTQPGKYTIRVEREDPADPKTILKSNTVTVTVTPP